MSKYIFHEEFLDVGSHALNLCMVARGVFSTRVNCQSKECDDVNGFIVFSESIGIFGSKYSDGN